MNPPAVLVSDSATPGVAARTHAASYAVAMLVARSMDTEVENRNDASADVS